MSLPSSFCVSAPPTSSRPSLSFPLGSGAKVGWQTEANTAQGRAEGDPKAGDLIMCMSVFLTPLLLASSRVWLCFGYTPLTVMQVYCWSVLDLFAVGVFDIVVCVCMYFLFACVSQWLCVSRRPSVTSCTDRRTHASRRGLWEGGVALRGCALLLSFPFFPPSRPSSPSVVRPSPPLTTGFRYFPFFNPVTPFPCSLSPRVPLALFSVLYRGLSPKRCLLLSVATPHSPRRHFGSMYMTGETFLQLRGTLRLPADSLLSPGVSISFCLNLNPSLPQDSRLWRGVNSIFCGFLYWTGVSVETGRRDDRPSWLLTDLRGLCGLRMVVSFRLV